MTTENGSLIEQYLPRVKEYLLQNRLAGLLGNDADPKVTPLAQGEYNLNYLLEAEGRKLVFRVNVGTQIDREDQILYEYKALKLLEPSGVTPKALFADDARTLLDRGVLLMEYLPGEPLDYTRDLSAAAFIFSKIHQVEVAAADNHLIAEEAPLTLITEECAGLLETYFNSGLAEEDIRSYLKEVLAWAVENRKTEIFYQQDPCPCIVNTEVNSGNFIIDRKHRTAHLVDWEMPRWGDPSQDLSHFCSPLTTLWKTDYRMSAEDKERFVDTYGKKLADAHLADTLTERIRLRDPYVYLRGISWSAMGWAAYQTEFSGVRNPDTWATLQRYLNIDFIRSLFDPFIGG